MVAKTATAASVPALYTKAPDRFGASHHEGHVRSVANPSAESVLLSTFATIGVSADEIKAREPSRSKYLFWVQQTIITGDKRRVLLDAVRQEQRHAESEQEIQRQRVLNVVPVTKVTPSRPRPPSPSWRRKCGGIPAFVGTNAAMITHGKEIYTMRCTGYGKGPAGVALPLKPPDLRDVIDVRPEARIVRFVRGAGKTGFVERPATLGDLKPGWSVSVITRYEGEREVAEVVKVVFER